MKSQQNSLQELSLRQDFRKGRTAKIHLIIAGENPEFQLVAEDGVPLTIQQLMLSLLIYRS